MVVTLKISDPSSNEGAILEMLQDELRCIAAVFEGASLEISTIEN